mmetsp:Transcript_60110/g.173357  ORF Transcript_60110/g.173357 Transcript_60110/m.173357 type:complete len:204 (-) Transcript_60110:171-782(-)
MSLVASAICAQMACGIWKDFASASGKDPSCIAIFPFARPTTSCVAPLRAAASSLLGLSCTNAWRSVCAPITSQQGGKRRRRMSFTASSPRSSVEKRKPRVGFAWSRRLRPARTCFGAPAAVTRDGRRSTSPTIRNSNRDAPATLLRSATLINSKAAASVSRGISVSGRAERLSPPSSPPLLSNFCRVAGGSIGGSSSWLRRPP